MSRESFLAFNQLLQKDKVLQRQVNALQDNNIQGLIQIADEAGFRITTDDVLASLRPYQSDDLSIINNEDGAAYFKRSSRR
ncbi:MAG: Nif11-like leader peptide family natural product precursor [Chloroflexota bacterium]